MFDWLKNKINGPTASAMSPDFTDIDSREKAEAMCQRGTLGKLLLLPIEFGGEDVGPNVVYAPPFAIELKQSTDRNVVAPVAESGKATRYAATPEYQGRSFIPIAIRIEASDPGQFAFEINIWGDAIRRASRSK